MAAEALVLQPRFVRVYDCWMRGGLRVTLVLMVVGLVVACGGTAVIDATGSGGAGAGGDGGSAGAGGSSDPAWDAFCEALIPDESGGNCAKDVDRCRASASCDGWLKHGPGSALFDCMLKSGCETCLLDIYTSGEFTPAGVDFGERCIEVQMDGCPLFEDLFLAGMLFTDAHLVTMGGCLELPSCGEIEACLDELYGACMGWAYAYEF